MCSAHYERMTARPIVREYTIDGPNGWEPFVREAWAKTPARIALRGISVSEERLFGLLCSIAGRERQGQRTMMRVYPESRAQRVLSAEGDQLVNPERAQCLPVEADGGFSKYCARVRARLGRGAALVADNLERFDADLWLEVRRAFRGLLDRVPVFSRQGMMTFAGDYASTPFGVHKDDEHVFHVAVCGPKRMRFWTKEFVAQHPELNGLMDYSAFLEGSVAVESTPNEILYWPSGLYHVGECDGAAAHFSVGFKAPRAAATEVWAELAHLVWNDLITEISDDAQLTDPIAEPCLLDEAKAEVRRRFELILRDQRLDRGLKRLWLRRKTADGFENVPEPRARVQLAHADILQADANFPIRCVDLGGDQMLCGAHGHSIKVPCHGAIHGLVTRLNSGEPIAVHEAVNLVMSLREDATGQLDAGPEDIQTVLETLLTMRAFDRVAP
jgi:hypothetical protein